MCLSKSDKIETEQKEKEKNETEKERKEVCMCSCVLVVFSPPAYQSKTPSPQEETAVRNTKRQLEQQLQRTRGLLNDLQKTRHAFAAEIKRVCQPLDLDPPSLAISTQRYPIPEVNMPKCVQVLTALMMQSKDMRTADEALVADVKATLEETRRETEALILQSLKQARFVEVSEIGIAFYFPAKYLVYQFFFFSFFFFFFSFSSLIL